MEIKTKLDIDQKAFTLQNDKIEEVEIAAIKIVCVSGITKIVYNIYDERGGKYSLEIHENKIFGTKEELTSSLMDNCK